MHWWHFVFVCLICGWMKYGSWKKFHCESSVYLIWMSRSLSPFLSHTVTSPSDVSMKANDDTKLTRARCLNNNRIASHTTSLTMFVDVGIVKFLEKKNKIRWWNENRRSSSHSWDVIPLIRKSCFGFALFPSFCSKVSRAEKTFTFSQRIA